MIRKINNIKMLILSVMVALSTISCENWLDVSPKSEVKGSELFEDETAFRDVLIGVYSSLSSTSDNMYEFNDVLAQYYKNPADDAIQFGHGKFYLATYDYTYSSVESLISSIWSAAYTDVVNLNYALEIIDDKRYVFSTDATFNIVKGEMLALRAMLQFDMFRFFAPAPSMGLDLLAIPYVTEYTIETQTQLTVKDHLAAVIKDVTEARELMRPYDPVGPISDTMSNEFKATIPEMLENRITRMNYYATSTLLARVYAYAGYGDEAYNTAKATIDEISNHSKTLFSLTDDTNKDANPLFANEVLFKLLNEDLAEYEETVFGVGVHERTILSLDPAAMTDFYSGLGTDYRKANQISESTDEVYITKFQNQEYMPMFRMSELYYIAAEYAPEAEGREYLNTIMAHRGLSPMAAGDDLFRNLYHEYRREFVGEGQLFFFYKRYYDKFEKIGTSDAYEIEDPLAVYILPLPINEVDFGDYKQ